MPSWISVNESLPQFNKLVWIHVKYEKSPYDDVTERVSIGVMNNNEKWQDLFDFPFADDFTVDYWMDLYWPKFQEGD